MRNEALSNSSEAGGESPNHRSVYRVPVFSDSGLSCRLAIAGCSVAARVFDLSLTGLAARVSAADARLFAALQPVDVQLTLQTDCYACTGTVCRVSGGQVAVRFPLELPELDLRPPRALLRIVMCLQRRSLRPPTLSGP